MDKPIFQTIEEARRWASVFLREQNREERVADLLLEHYLGMSFAQLLAFAKDPFQEEKAKEFMASVKEHAETGKPVQHIIGTAPFYGREFFVNHHVLIPRPETEELVVGVLDWIENNNAHQSLLADIGTGSGAIAISLKRENPDLNVIATDLSDDALEVAKRNAQSLEADVKFLQGDFLEPVSDQNIEILVSNPPYISWEAKSSMDDTVIDFDPELALFADENGLAAYYEIVRQINGCDLSPRLIAFEIGYDQGQAVKALIEQELTGYRVKVKQDLNKKDRMIFAERID
ncbi:peptide chain release factor N(5)-glutamine methyltransferase [Halobacillus fulvus]|nr:peptide chain release factor N(5)-glutamine methyltransferase [Halobacillus fulvus]